MGLEGGQLLYLYIIIEREKEERDTVLYKAIIIMQAYKIKSIKLDLTFKHVICVYVCLFVYMCMYVYVYDIKVCFGWCKILF